MTCYTEFDEIQEALKKVRINEDVCPLRYGMFVKEGADTYGKMQKLLACNEMENCHKFIYDLDPENLDDQDVDKINQLFDLGVKKGYIDNSFEEEFQKEQNPDAYVPAEEPAPVAVQQQGTCCPNVPNSCWTILYSATKNGETKCGECFSNSTSVSAAKADCMAKLTRFGYENISILAIEAGDPDCFGCNENDMLKDRPHNAHVSVEDVKETETDRAEVAGDEIDEAGNPYAAGMKVVTGGSVSSAKKTTKKKCVKEDDDSADDGNSDEGNSDEGNSDKGNSDEGDSDEGSSEDEGSDEGSEDEGSDEGDSDEGSSEDEGSDEGSEDEGSDEGSEDEGSDEGSEDEGSDEGDSDEGEGDSDEELDDDKKAQYKTEYKQVFKDVMLKCKFEDKCFNDLTIEQKVTFFETLNDKWNKAEPNKFMTPKEEEQLNAVVVSNS